MTTQKLMNLQYLINQQTQLLQDHFYMARLMMGDEFQDVLENTANKLGDIRQQILKMGLGYHNIGLIPRHVSELEHREEADTSIEFAGVKLTIPLIASPMPDVCDGKMAKKLFQLGSYGFIHRFWGIEKQAKEFVISEGNCGCAIGIKDDYKERFQELKSLGCKSFVIDIANGANKRVEKVINEIYENDIYLTVGNVASKQCFEWLTQFPIHAVRVGISGGSACSSRTETGIFHPPVSLLLEIAELQCKKPLIIADGGINEPQDLCKSIIFNSSVCMAGGVFAATEESPGQIIKTNSELYKIYRGAASFSTQQLMKQEKPEYVEGAEKLIPYTGSVEKVIKRFRNGLRSSMSYMNARNLDEYKKNSYWCIIS